MLTLYQGKRPQGWNGIPNISPFCVKLETYLRMAKIEYKPRAADPRKAPKAKIPFIDHDGKRIADSNHIIAHLKQRFGDKVDAHLTAEQRALALALTRMTEEHTYYIGMFFRWGDDVSFQKLGEFFKPLLPKLIGPMILKALRKNFLKTVHLQGVGRHSRAEVLEMGKEDIEAWSALLGDKPYFLGDKPSSLDATMYGFLVNTLWVPWPSEYKDFALTKTNLVAFCDRMHAAYFPDVPRS